MKSKKINLTVRAPALIKMITDLVNVGLADTESEAVNVLLRELYDCRKRTNTQQAQEQPQQEQAVQEIEIPPDNTERLSF